MRANNLDKVKIYKNVHLGKNCNISPFVILGKPPLNKKDGELALEIGMNAIIRSFTTIYTGNRIGNNFTTGQNVSIRENNIIGNNVIIGSSSTIEFENVIGDGTHIHSGCFLEMTKVGKNVFVGPNVVFTDDPHPMKCPHYKECKGGPILEDMVKVGANCTILPGVRIGRNSLIGAGSVVTKDVPPDSVYAGSPARFIKKIIDLECEKGFFDKPYLWEPYI
ncbi:2,3,4,5-tetrahydropyridine-2,6-dicarboxylate N-acetyltransferase [subsurface metagenome]|nr:transferase [Clostridia bacterium]